MCSLVSVCIVLVVACSGDCLRRPACVVHPSSIEQDAIADENARRAPSVNPREVWAQALHLGYDMLARDGKLYVTAIGDRHAGGEGAGLFVVDAVSLSLKQVLTSEKRARVVCFAIADPWIGAVGWDKGFSVFDERTSDEVLSVRNSEPAVCPVVPYKGCFLVNMRDSNQVSRYCERQSGWEYAGQLTLPERGVLIAGASHQGLVARGPSGVYFEQPGERSGVNFGEPIDARVEGAAEHTVAGDGVVAVRYLSGNSSRVVLFGECVGGWQVVQVLESPRRPRGNAFGAALLFHGGELFVGDPVDRGGEKKVGAVFVYRRGSGGRWGLRRVVDSGSMIYGFSFGMSLAVAGGKLFIGAPELAQPRARGSVFWMDVGRRSVLQRLHL